MPVAASTPQLAGMTQKDQCIAVPTTLDPAFAGATRADAIVG